MCGYKNLSRNGNGRPKLYVLIEQTSFGLTKTIPQRNNRPHVRALFRHAGTGWIQ